MRHGTAVESICTASCSPATVAHTVNQSSASIYQTHMGVSADSRGSSRTRRPLTGTRSAGLMSTSSLDRMRPTMSVLTQGSTGSTVQHSQAVQN